MNVIDECQKKIKTLLEEDLSKVILELIRKAVQMQQEVRNLEKEIPHMFKDRTQKLITQLEHMAKSGEQRIDELLGGKLHPMLDSIETWLKHAAKMQRNAKPSKTRKHKKTKNLRSKTSKKNKPKK